MSATLVSSNTTIKVNGAVSANATASASGTLYTAPANGYAEVYIMVTTTTATLWTVSIQGFQLATGTGAYGTPGTFTTRIPPGGSITYTIASASANATIYVRGVEFVNTP